MENDVETSFTGQTSLQAMHQHTMFHSINMKTTCHRSSKSAVLPDPHNRMPAKV